MKRGRASDGKSSSKGRQTHIPSDFKRVKAKVGKRAPGKANDTETAFRTAGINVRKQSIAQLAPASAALRSSRGKKMGELLCELNHVSAKARASALQGIKDAAGLSSPPAGSRAETDVRAVHPLLPRLIPALCKRFLDEDGKVRSLAIALLFHGLLPGMAAPRAGGGSAMLPFVPLVVAYVTSALHSLDSDVRCDGCAALELLCTRCAALFLSPRHCANRRLVRAALPAFGKLVDDVGAAAVPAEAAAPSRRRGAPPQRARGRCAELRSPSKAVAVLRSLVSLLKIVTHSASLTSTDDHLPALSAAPPAEPSFAMPRHAPNTASLLPSLTPHHFAFLPGGTASNALLLLPRGSGLTDTSAAHPPIVLNHGIAHLHHFTDAHAGNAHTPPTHNAQPASQRNISFSTQQHLLAKLRDRFVEVTQRGHIAETDSATTATGAGISLSLPNVEELTLLVTSLRLVWNGSCRLQIVHFLQGTNPIVQHSKQSQHYQTVLQWKKIRSLSIAIQNLFLESLPIRDNSDNQANVHCYDLLNASLCCAISEFGSALSLFASNNNTNTNTASNNHNNHNNHLSPSKWVDAIFTYLLPRLQKETPYYQTHLGTSDKSTAGPYNNNTINSNTRVTLLKVITQLLVRDEFNSTHTKHRLGSCPLENHHKRMQLLQKFSQAFFGCNMDVGVDDDAADADNLNFMPYYRLAEHRKAAALLATLITQQILLRNTNLRNKKDYNGIGDNTADDDDNDYHDSDWLDTWQLLAKMASVLPSYLKSWRGSFPKLSNTILATLLSITRFCPESALNQNGDNETDTTTFESVTSKLCTSLRTSITALFTLSPKKFAVIDESNNKIYKYKISVFEQLSQVSQRLTLGIVGMLRHPFDPLVLSLSEICIHKRCARKDANSSKSEESAITGLTDEMIDYTMNVLHSIRRTIPLRLYLTFLVSSTGINGAAGNGYVNHGSTKNATKGSHEIKVKGEVLTPPESEDFVEGFDIAFITSYDKAIARSCRYLRECGGVKIVQMLSPVLTSWLGDGAPPSYCEDDSEKFMITMLKIRASLCILACFALDEVNGRGTDMDNILINAICNSILSISFARMIDSDERIKAVFLTILAPLLVLLRCEPLTLCRILKECGRKIESEKSNTKLNESLINSVLVLVKSTELQATLRISDVAKELKDTSTRIESVTSSGPLDMLGGTLQTEVQALLGFSF